MALSAQDRLWYEQQYDKLLRDLIRLGIAPGFATSNPGGLSSADLVSQYNQLYSALNAEQNQKDGANTEFEYEGLLQDFMDLFRPYIEGLDVDDIDRINRQNQAQEWMRVLEDYINGDATLEDLKNVDVSDLEGMDGWDDYYNGIINVRVGGSRILKEELKNYNKA